MKYRDNEIYHDLGLDDTGTKIIDLNFNDPLSAISFLFYGLNGGTSNKKNSMHDIVTKIELVDGSDVLGSLSLKELQALHAYQTGIFPYSLHDENADADSKDHATLFFGRWMWDREYFMPLPKFANPQLKITTDEDVIRAMGADGFLSGSLDVSIVAHVMEDEALTSKGFFMNKEIYSFTSGTSGNEYIELPRDYPYAAFMIHSTIRGSDWHELIANVKLSCDADKFIPLNRNGKDLSETYELQNPPFQMRGKFFFKNGETIQFPLYYNPRISVIVGAAKSLPGVSWIWSGNALMGLWDSDGAAVTSEESLSAMIFGTDPHCSMIHKFGIFNDPATYFDPTLWKEVQLILEQAAAGTVKIVLQQLRPLA